MDLFNIFDLNMKKIFFVFFLVSYSYLIFSQDEKYKVFGIGSIETGIFHRGIIGMSGSICFPLNKTENFMAVDGFIGASLTFRGAYMGIAPNINLGKNGLFFMAGFDCKSYQYSTGVLFNVVMHEGTTIAPFLGFHLIKDSNFSFKLRISIMPIFEEKKIDRYIPGFGVSFGYKFK